LRLGLQNQRAAIPADQRACGLGWLAGAVVDCRTIEKLRCGAFAVGQNAGACGVRLALTFQSVPAQKGRTQSSCLRPPARRAMVRADPAEKLRDGAR